VSVELRRRITVHGACAVVLKPGGNPLAGGLGRVVSAHAGLHKALQLVQGNRHAIAVSLANTIVPRTITASPMAFGY